MNADMSMVNYGTKLRSTKTYSMMPHASSNVRSQHSHWAPMTHLYQNLTISLAYSTDEVMYGRTESGCRHQSLEHTVGCNILHMINLNAPKTQQGLGCIL